MVVVGGEIQEGEVVMGVVGVVAGGEIQDEEVVLGMVVQMGREGQVVLVVYGNEGGSRKWMTEVDCCHSLDLDCSWWYHFYCHDYTSTYQLRNGKGCF